MPSSRSVSLSRSNCRRRAAELLGVARLDAVGELVEGERPTGLEQGRGEVHQAFEPVSHRRASTASTRSAYARPRARPRRPRPGTARGRRPRVGPSTRCAGRAARTAPTRRARRRRRGRGDGRCPRLVEIVAQTRRLLGLRRAGHRDRHAARGRRCAARWRCDARARRARSRPSANDTRRHAMGTPPSPLAASRIGPTSMPLNPSRVLVPTMPGPITTTAASACATCRATASAENTETAS